MKVTIWQRIERNWCCSGIWRRSGTASRWVMGRFFFSANLYLNLMIETKSRAEAALALRQRLNETVELFETLRLEHAGLEVKFDSLNRELTIAKSDRMSSSFCLLIDN